MKYPFLHNSICAAATIAIATLLSTGCAGAAQGTGTATQTTETTPGAQTKDLAGANPALTDPTKATEKAPDKFQVKVETTKGDFVIEVTRAWAPNGADRFYNMVKIGYFKDIAIFRAVEGFMFQFGIHGTPAIATKWSESTFKDDPSHGISNVPGTLSFAQTGRPNSRSVQMFVNLGVNSFLDQQAAGTPFVPFGKVVAPGMDVVKKINTEYGENPRGENIQGDLKTKGNDFIKKRFPNIDYIKSVTVIEN